MQANHIGAKLNIAGTLEWRDKDGNILSTTRIQAAIPLSELGLTQDQAEELVKESHLGPDHCQ